MFDLPFIPVLIFYSLFLHLIHPQTETSNKADFSILHKSDIDSNYIIDQRDGQIYHFIKIGQLFWLTDNMRFQTKGSACYNDSLHYCSKYGRMYPYEDAQIACPKGWHLQVLKWQA